MIKFNSHGKSSDEHQETALEFKGSFIYNERDNIIKEGLKIGVFSYDWK